MAEAGLITVQSRFDVAETINRLTEENAQLKADLHREEDRCAMLVDEVNRWRNDALKSRALNQEYETTLANIGLMTVSAQENLRSSRDLEPSHEPIPGTLAALGKVTL